MTDLNTLMNILDRADIEYEGNETLINGYCERTISVERGYAGFITTFRFDKDGKLVDMGAYE